MSKYPHTYTDSKGREWAIEEMPNGHLHNAAKKLERERDAAFVGGEHTDDVRQTILLSMQQEIEEREAKAQEAARAEADAFDPDGL